MYKIFGSAILIFFVGAKVEKERKNTFVVDVFFIIYYSFLIFFPIFVVFVLEKLYITIVYYFCYLFAYFNLFACPSWHSFRYIFFH